MTRTYEDQWYRTSRPHEALSVWAKEVENRQSGRAQQLLYDLRMYGDRELIGYSPTQYSKEPSTGGPPVRLSLNIVRSCVDSAVSMACENQPRVEWLTTDGDWSLQRKAKMRTKFTDGLFYQGKVLRERRKAIKDAVLMGTGLVKVLERHGKVRYERRFPGNVHCDEQEAYEGNPRNLLEVIPFDRQVLMSLFPSKAKKIKSEGSMESTSQFYFGRDPTCDQVLVREAWHLPSHEGADDGRHVVAIKSETLVSEPWKSSRFPFGIWRWSEEPLGFWGVGLGHQLMGLQFEINQLLETIQWNIYNGGNLKIAVERAANIVQAHLTNSLKVPIIEYSGAKPEWIVHDVVSPQIMNHLWQLKQEAYAITGISEMHAQASTPSSITSGRQAAIYANMHSKRFLTFGQGDEDAMLDLAVLSLDAAERIYEKEGTYKVSQRDKNWLQEIEIEDVVGDADDFQPEASQSSMLPRSVPGKMAIVEAWQNLGWVSPERGKKMVGIKDLEVELETSPGDLIDQRIELILEEGILHPPTPRMDLALARERGQLAYNRAVIVKSPSPHIEKLLTWLDLIDDQEKKARKADADAAAVAVGAMPTDPSLGAVPPVLPPEQAGMAPAIPPAPGAPVPSPMTLQ